MGTENRKNVLPPDRGLWRRMHFLRRISFLTEKTMKRKFTEEVEDRDSFVEGRWGIHGSQLKDKKIGKWVTYHIMGLLKLTENESP